MSNTPTDTFIGNVRAVRARWLIEFTGFWLLGLCNNFGYVVMLSAAHDILKSGNTTEPTHNTTNQFDCNQISTGAILLADILPALVIKVTAPFFMHRIIYNIRFVLIVLFAASALIIVGTSNVIALSLFGVACASISSGFGEITMLQLTSFYEKHTVGAWSSGTGAAGLLGALSYAGLTSLLKLSPRVSILILLFIPVLQIFSYFLVGAHRATSRHRYEEISSSPPTDTETGSELIPMGTEYLSFPHADDNKDGESPKVRHETVGTPQNKWALVKPLLKYMIPLSLVYFAEYLINQGLYELIFFRNNGIKHSEQYRWYSVCYQLGVFISRSSIYLIKINRLWILPIVQFTNMGIFFACVYRTEHIPTIWLVFLLIIFEGFIGGGAYVNTFYKISIEIPERDREFSLGVASVGDSFGITLAGLSAIPLHNTICH